MENVKLSNLELIKLAIKTMLDADPQTDFTTLQEDIQLTELSISHIARYYEGAVQPFIHRAKLGILDLATLAQIVTSQDWAYHSVVLGIDKCADLYPDLNARAIKLHLRLAEKIADTYLGYGYFGSNRTPDELFNRMIAETLVYGQLTATYREDRTIMHRFISYFPPESVQSASDLESFIFSYNFVQDRIYSANSLSLSKYLSQYYLGASVTAKRLTNYITRAKDYSNEYFPNTTPSRALTGVADTITSVIYPTLQEA